MVALILSVFSPQPGCSYSVVVKSDEENGIDHSLPGSRLVQVGSVVVLAVNVCVYRRWEVQSFIRLECILNLVCLSVSMRCREKLVEIFDLSSYVAVCEHNKFVDMFIKYPVM